jgi:hypothetical protein
MLTQNDHSQPPRLSLACCDLSSRLATRVFDGGRQRTLRFQIRTLGIKKGSVRFQRSRSVLIRLRWVRPQCGTRRSFVSLRFQKRRRGLNLLEFGTGSRFLESFNLGCRTDRAFWGIRLCDRTDSNIDFWMHRGVWCETFDSFDDYPAYLMKICEKSADMLIKAKIRPQA